MTQPPQTQPAALPGCWWHPSRQTGLSCVRCGRPACPDCLREASVGAQCIDCVQAGRRQGQVQRRQYPSARTVAGARVSQRVVVTPALIALNVLVYAFTAVQAHDPMNNQLSDLFKAWVLWPPGIAGGEWWRLVTGGFLHYGPVHLAVNMISLWIIGRQLEVVLGKGRYLALYVLSLVGGSVLVYLLSGLDQPTAGASGAIYGLLGGILVVVLRLRLNPAGAIGTIVLNLIITVSLPNISLFGHLGGLVTGALATAALVYAPAKNRVAWQSAAFAVVAVALVGLFFLRDAQLASIACSGSGATLECSGA
ncbi:membrane associated rhomboid family serine protease [Amycolatopsis bartoniae]|uniref:Rhomboid family intramembrane serine protease n=1 Tax=Amycolatopsis bartoniae TaxID=941986 RepID=A0A8H9ME39_9PSEU|nr:rhomboid family intramembrane serine protease [Amycolatopsis bartoniae]MBB2933245.1 membrane associated rhomboid family serine protease [Amycolatopsis bartoniae]TVT11767.1 rhomboid family intramembrane serine protease [Amycolatopsis bartoniae]GHF58137.1 rhomboid family intramembrane serine protease [Amycolatopsis bartoniae]